MIPEPVDLGIVAMEFVSLLSGFLVEFLVAAVALFVAFWSVRKGVRWLLRLAGGAPSKGAVSTDASWAAYERKLRRKGW